MGNQQKLEKLRRTIQQVGKEARKAQRDVRGVNKLPPRDNNKSNRGPGPLA